MTVGVRGAGEAAAEPPASSRRVGSPLLLAPFPVTFVAFVRMLSDPKFAYPSTW
jgi:hypothetical protein